MGVQVFAFLLKPPDDACEAARVVVTSESAADAARAIRRAGWHGVRWRAASLSRDDDEQRVALAHPGIVWWYPWTQEPPRAWRRVT